MLTREQYHQKRLNKAIAQVRQNFYDFYGDCARWPEWVFEEEKKAIQAVAGRIGQEDGFAA